MKIKFCLSLLAITFPLSISDGFSQITPRKASVMVKVIGVHPIKAHEPVHLIEMEINCPNTVFDIGKVTQEDDSQPQSNWQAPYSEHLLNGDGTTILADDFEILTKPELLKGSFRVAFFFHYLDIKKPLVTQFGNVSLPPVTGLPKRLKIIKYESPD